MENIILMVCIMNLVAAILNMRLRFTEPSSPSKPMAIFQRRPPAKQKPKWHSEEQEAAIEHESRKNAIPL